MNTNQNYREGILCTLKCYFNNENSDNRFVNYINLLHGNTNFTIEKEQGRSLTFLKPLIMYHLQPQYVENKQYKHNRYFFSIMQKSTQINIVETFIYCTYHLSSSYVSFSKELKRLCSLVTLIHYPQFRNM